MRALAVAAVMTALSGCAAMAPGPVRVSVAEGGETPAVLQATPRRSQQDLLAAYWAERRAARTFGTAPIVTYDGPARFAYSQNSPLIMDDDAAQRENTRRLNRESAATRAAVRAALGR